MIIPIKDAKVSQFTARSFTVPVHLLSTTRGPINAINNYNLTRKIVLSTCVDKEYVIAFSDYDTLIKYKESNKHPYYVNSADISDVLRYGERTHTSLLIMHEQLWYKLDPGSKTVSIHTIDFFNR